MNRSSFLMAVCVLACLPLEFLDSIRPAAYVALWLAPVLSPTDLSRPRGLGAWTLWALWGLFSALLCREPLAALSAAAPQATGILLFALAYSWWGRPHRRGYLLGLWGVGLFLGVQAAVSGRVSPEATGFVLAAVGSCLGVYLGPLPEQKSWRTAFAVFSVLFLVLAGVMAVRTASGVSLRVKSVLIQWRGDAAVALMDPWLGAGPGLFKRGWDQLPQTPSGVMEWPRYEGRNSAGSEWASAAAETGLPGLLLMVFALAFSMPGLRKGRLDIMREWERRSTAAAFGVLLLFSLAERIFLSPALLFLWFTLLANAAPGEEEEESRVLRISRPAAALAAVFCLGGFWARPERTEPASHWGSSLARLEKAEDFSPRDARQALAKAEIYLSLGALPEARREAERALGLEPYFPAARLTLAEVLHRSGDRRGARLELSILSEPPKAAAEVSNDYARALVQVDAVRLEHLRRHVQ